MMNLPPGTKVYVCCRPTDMRKGFNGLTAQVSNILHADPYSGQLFVFRGKRGDYVKILYWDGTGLCLFAKRLEKSRFVWPPLVDGGFPDEHGAARIAAGRHGLAAHGADRCAAPACFCLTYTSTDRIKTDQTTQKYYGREMLYLSHVIIVFCITFRSR